MHKADLVLGLVFSGAIKGMMAGITITIIGGLIAGIERIWDPVRLLYLLLVVGSAALCHDQLHVSDDGARERSAGAACNFRRAQYAALFSLGRDLSDGRISALAALDFACGSLHLCGARA